MSRVRSLSFRYLRGDVDEQAEEEVAALQPGLWPRGLQPRHYQVLQAVHDGRVIRKLDLGRFEPHLFQGADVTRTLRGLAIRGLIRFRPVGPPEVTYRGRRVLNSAD